jgi:hypothetical protein
MDPGDDEGAAGAPSQRNDVSASGGATSPGGRRYP